jgi:hypothetical protein
MNWNSNEFKIKRFKEWRELMLTAGCNLKSEGLEEEAEEYLSAALQMLMEIYNLEAAEKEAARV